MRDPLVSCIMPTANRRGFVVQAIRYFLRQDYQHRELIVVDDGVDAVADLMPTDSRVRYERLPRSLVLGAKRNRACELASGKLIAHWDDDDWASPCRLSRQVEHLLSQDADISGLTEVLHYRVQHGDVWLYRAPTELDAPVAGCSLLYRRAVWERCPFDEVVLGEDSAFVAANSSARLAPLRDRSLLVAVMHGQNTGDRRLTPPAWERRQLAEVAHLLGDDRSFYVAMRHGGSTPPSAPDPPARGSVVLNADFNVFTGYGSMAEYLALSMARTGALVRPVPLSLSSQGLSPEFLALLQRTDGSTPGPLLYHSWIRPGGIARPRQGADLFVRTMWEGSRLPAGWSDALGSARAVIVPSRFVADVFRSSGVKVPIEVVPDGVDPDVYHYEHRDDRLGLTTLVVAPVDARKHTDRAVAAWHQVFGGDPNARLVIKTTYGYRNYQSDDPRICYVDRPEPTRGIAHWYRDADVLVAVGSEGFGLPLVEAMATGLPVIALDAAGQADVCRDAEGMVLPVPSVGQEAHYHDLLGDGGTRPIPDVGRIADHLRWVATHRAEAAELGRMASRWARTHRDVWRTGPAILDVMERYASRRIRLRPRRVQWVPSLGGTCGIAEYVSRLAQEVPGVAWTRAAPAGRRDLVHVHHHSALFDDAELARQLQRFRHGGCRVVVTEHGGLPGRSSWEEQADALVSATAAGAEILRARWPTTAVQHIPLGCETWFPPRKPRRGRVVATFGLLGPHKRIESLAAAVAKLGRSELLVFAPLGPGAVRPRLPCTVRWETRWRPLEEIVTRLAAEADVIAYWYAAVAEVAASSAVTAGLAAGVPVVASPTPWFADLRDITHQPVDLVQGLERALVDEDLRRQLVSHARDWCHDNSWARVAARHRALWESLDSA